MIFHPATVVLRSRIRRAFRSARICWSTSPSFTVASFLASNLLALFRRQIPAALLPAARDRLALRFQLCQPSRAPRLHGGNGAGLAIRRRRSGRTPAVKAATLGPRESPIPAPVAPQELRQLAARMARSRATARAGSRASQRRRKGFGTGYAPRNFTMAFHLSIYTPRVQRRHARIKQWHVRRYLENKPARLFIVVIGG